MKIAYVSFMPNPINGVEKKIIQMAKASKDYDIDFYILNNNLDKVEDNLIYKKFDIFNIPFSLKLQQQLFTHLLISKNVDFNKYEYIVLRYVGACSLGSSYFFYKYGNKIFSEHHTNEDIEYKEYRKGFINWIKFGLESYCSKRNLKHVKGIIGVTKEIVDIELKKSGKKSFFTFSNGINNEIIPFTPAKRFDNKVLKVIFIASNEASWHGLDKLVLAIREYKGAVKIELHIVGGFDTTKYKDINIISHGFLQSKELDNLFMKMNIGVSSLGLERLGLKSASVLKSREYMSRGIPFIYSYIDEDFLDSSLALYLNKVDIQSIINYLNNTTEEHFQKMRDFSSSNLDWKHKIKNLYNYIQGHECSFQNIILDFACKKFIEKGIFKGSSILELGFGEGNDLIELHQNGFITYGVEVLDFKYKETERKLKKLGLDTNRLYIINPKQFLLSNRNNSINAVFSNQVFEHIEDMEQVASELNRVMKLNGLIYSEYAATYPFIDSHTGLPPLHLLKNKKVIYICFLILKKIKRWDRKKFTKVYLYYRRYLYYRSYREVNSIFKKYGFYVSDITYKRREHRLQKDGIGTLLELIKYKIFKKTGSSQSLGIVVKIYLKIHASLYKYTKNRVVLIEKIKEL